ncbi:MAG: GNAT family N-acetyltransferase [Frankia sp.]
MVLPVELWPLSGLVVRTPTLELRAAREADLVALAEVASDGIHDPEFMPFSTPWTDTTPLERARSVLRWHWGRWSQWQPDDWALDLVVLLDGVVVGTQGLQAKDFAVRREIDTGSWLGREYQGAGIGTRMRRAALHLIFAGLEADFATSGAFEDNPASLAVSRKLGYVDDGIERWARRGRAATVRRVRLSREAWGTSVREGGTPQAGAPESGSPESGALESGSPEPVTIHGLPATLPWFGISDAIER